MSDPWHVVVERVLDARRCSLSPWGKGSASREASPDVCLDFAPLLIPRAHTASERDALSMKAEEDYAAWWTRTVAPLLRHGDAAPSMRSGVFRAFSALLPPLPDAERSDESARGTMRAAAWRLLAVELMDGPLATAEGRREHAKAAAFASGVHTLAVQLLAEGMESAVGCGGGGTSMWCTVWTQWTSSFISNLL